MATVPARADAVLSYWFGADYAQPQPPSYWVPAEQSKLWFRAGPDVDQHIKQHFSHDLEALAAGEYDAWKDTPLATVAGIVLADQFTRNVHCGTAQAFALDQLALEWSRHLRECDGALASLPSAPLRYFSYMPLMHSEVLADQELLVRLVEGEVAALQQDPDSPAAKAWVGVIPFAEAHRAVVAKWGRFPHRNLLLGRPCTPEEVAGLQDGSIPAW